MNPFIGYEYKKIIVDEERVALYLDCYENFGWFTDEKTTSKSRHSQMEIQLKRDRNLANRMELTRLQRHFEACANEMETLERSKASSSAVWAIFVGGLGTVFIAGATFAITQNPPVTWLCILLAIPGFAGWLLPYFIYHGAYRKREKKIHRLMEAKQEELYEICEKGHSLL